MRIVIATGICPPDIGGPAKYAAALAREFEALGHRVRVVSFGAPERLLPFGLRHLWFFLRIILPVAESDAVLALDAVSVGLPAVCAARLLARRVLLRIGGDFLWESYSERSGGLVPLPDFYARRPELSIKERLIFRAQKFVLRSADALVFNSSWLADIWQPVYGLVKDKVTVVGNHCERGEGSEPRAKVFLSAGRPIRLKNMERVRRAFKEAQRQKPEIALDEWRSAPEEFERRLKESYAVICVSISEVSPNIVYEALAYGKPCIITKYSGLPEEVKAAGVFADPFDENDIRDKILALSDEATYAKVKERIRAAPCHQSWRDIAEEYIRLLS